MRARMEIVKGILLGVGLFFIGSIVYLFVRIQAGAPRAIGTTAIRGWVAETLANPLYWITFVVAQVAGYAIVHFWPHRPVV